MAKFEINLRHGLSSGEFLLLPQESEIIGRIFIDNINKYMIDEHVTHKQPCDCQINAIIGIKRDLNNCSLPIQVINTALLKLAMEMVIHTAKTQFVDMNAYVIRIKDALKDIIKDKENHDYV